MCKIFKVNEVPKKTREPLQLEKQRKGHGTLGCLSRDETQEPHVYLEGMWSVVQWGTSSTEDVMQDLAPGTGRGRLPQVSVCQG